MKIWRLRTVIIHWYSVGRVINLDKEEGKPKTIKCVWRTVE